MWNSLPVLIQKFKKAEESYNNWMHWISSLKSPKKNTRPIHLWVILPISSTFSWEIMNMEILPKELYEATVALIPKLDKESMRKEIYI